MNKTLSSIEEAVKRIAESGTVAVVLPDQPGMEIIGTAAALISGLRALNKAVTVFAPPAIAAPDTAWQHTGQEDEPLREFIISFDLTRSPVKELKYERAENRLNIILSPIGSRIRREDIEFRYGELRYDLIITVGVPNLEAAQASIRRVPELLLEKPILNITSDPASAGYGELNLIPTAADEGQRQTLAELVHAILTSLKVPSDDPERSNALFAALWAATGEFQPLRTSAAAFSLAGELLSRGADPAAVRSALIPHRNLAQDQLAARAMVRSRFQKDQDILWSLLTREDFVKTNTNPADVPAVFQKITDALPYAGRYTMLWQGEDGQIIRCFLACRGRKETEQLASALGLNSDGKVMALNETFSTFAAAEEHIAQLLRKADGVE